MKEVLKVSETEDVLTIEIYPHLKPMVKAGFVFQGLLYLGLSFHFSLSMIREIRSIDWSILLLGFAIVLWVIMFIAGFRLLNKVVRQEVVVVTKEKITIIKKQLATKSRKSYLVAEISDFKLVGPGKYTPHPLEGSNNDYYGLGVAEKEAQYLIEEARIMFFYNGSTRSFGSDIGFWDAQEIITRIEKFTCNNLQVHDKMEELLKKLDDEAYADNEE